MTKDTGGERTTVYLVVYGNYWPWEVESVWSTMEAAQERADALPGDWGVFEMRLDYAPGEEEAER